MRPRGGQGTADGRLAELAADLAAERASLRSLVADLDEAAWRMPTPSEPWTIRDQIAHLGYFDRAAAIAAVDPAEFQKMLLEASADMEGYTSMTLAVPPTPGSRLLPWWDAQIATFDEAYAALPPGTRVPWYGPSMSGASMMTARLMETWAHGQDVRDALGVAPSATARLRHVAWLALQARPYVYAIRSRPAPPVRVRLELLAPDGSEWRIGEEGAEEVVRGSALEFCLVLTQRRNVADTALEADGRWASEWLRIGQAFAGPAGPGRPPSSASDAGPTGE